MQMPNIAYFHLSPNINAIFIPNIQNGTQSDTQNDTIPKIIKRTQMADLIIINKQEVIDAVIKECNEDGAYGYMDATSIIDLLNRLSESIIRCKDCALWNDGKCDTWSALGITILTAETGYCNFGDRRDDG